MYKDPITMESVGHPAGQALTQWMTSRCTSSEGDKLKSKYGWRIHNHNHNSDAGHVIAGEYQKSVCEGSYNN